LNQVINPMLFVAQQDGPVLKQGPSASQLGTADNLPASDQHFASGRLGKAGA